MYRRRTDNAMAKRKSTKGQEEFEDTKGIIRTHVSKKNRQHNGQKKKNRQHNGQKTEEQTTQWPKEEEQTTQWSKDRRTDNTMAKRKKNKRTNNELQNRHIKLKIE
jgi:hypothetical protein